MTLAQSQSERARRMRWRGAWNESALLVAPTGETRSRSKVPHSKSVRGETCDRGRSVRLTIAALALGSLTAPALTAQDCRGVPARYAHAMVDRRVLSNGSTVYGGEAGLAYRGQVGFYGNYSSADIGLSGSRTLSYGGSVYRQMSSSRLAACLTGGYQMGKSYLINAAGTNENLRVTQGRISIGAAASIAFQPLPGTRLTLFAFPSLLLGKKKTLVYDRVDTTSIEDSPPPVAYVGGASIAVSRIFARAYWVKSGDSEGLVVLAGGIAW